MIPNIKKGCDFHKLLAYLVGPGRHEEHSHPHIVGGDPTIVVLHDRLRHEDLGPEKAMKIADQLGLPARAYKARGKNVWHCSLSLRRGEQPLSDELWEQIVGEFMTEMGFVQPPCELGFRWVAVRHGLATDGRDHVHIVATTVHEDHCAAKWDDGHDFWRAQRICRALENKHGLFEVGSARHGNPIRASKRAEIERAKREGKSETDRDRLQRIVRACAVASSCEAEFLARLRTLGLSVSLRRDAERGDGVVGYSVALVSPNGQERLRYGGGKLARDLTLPRLRQLWAAEPTPRPAAA